MICPDCGARESRRISEIYGASGNVWIPFECGSAFFGIPQDEDYDPDIHKCPNHGTRIVDMNLSQIVLRIIKDKDHALVPAQISQSFRYECGCIFVLAHRPEREIVYPDFKGASFDFPEWCLGHEPNNGVEVGKYDNPENVGGYIGWTATDKWILWEH